MPFTGDSFAHLYDWLLDPQRQEKIVNARLEAEFDGVDTGLSAVAARATALEGNAPTSGTFTPALTFAVPGDLNIAYTVQTGAYRRIGPLVFINFVILTSTFTHSTASGSATITGLPVASISESRGSINVQGITQANYTQWILVVSGSGSTATIQASGSGQGNTAVAAAQMPTGGTVLIAGSAVYFAS
jgi:hypothetical protein